MVLQSLPLVGRCRVALLIGSGPNAVDARRWEIPPNVSIVCINNAHAVRDDWRYLVHALDFPADKMPKQVGPGQVVVSGEGYVPAMNAHGGIVYGGATMALAAAYWAMHHLRPHVLAYIGCDMDYKPQAGKTHFYGTGSPDPLREDPTLRDLRAKSARQYLLALARGTITVNLSRAEFSRLAVPRASVDDVFSMRRWRYRLLLRRLRSRASQQGMQSILALEDRVGYRVPDGVYWTRTYDHAAIDAIDAAWAAAGRDLPAAINSPAATPQNLAANGSRAPSDLSQPPVLPSGSGTM
jgi:acyl-coenzyme A thioesterase PaaI-like protein